MREREREREVLDACCGARFFHFEKDNPDVEFMDSRVGNFSCYGRTIIVEPDTIADFRDIPYVDE